MYVLQVVGVCVGGVLITLLTSPVGNTLWPGGKRGGIIGRLHYLKDTASGARQHPLRTYMGTSSTAEGDATEQLFKHLKVRAGRCSAWRMVCMVWCMAQCVAHSTSVDTHPLPLAGPRHHADLCYC